MKASVAEGKALNQWKKGKLQQQRISLVLWGVKEFLEKFKEAATRCDTCYKWAGWIETSSCKFDHNTPNKFKDSDIHNRDTQNNDMINIPATRPLILEHSHCGILYLKGLPS